MNSLRKHYKFLLFLVAIIIVSAIGVSYYLWHQSRENANSKAAESLTAPADVPFLDTSGTAIDLDQYANRIRVVNSWASWSPFSKDELLHLNEIAKEYNPKGIIFLAINRKENQEYAKSYLSTFPELPDLKIIFDPADTFFKQVDGYAMPETVIFDQQGNLVRQWRGTIKAEELKEAIDQLLTDATN